MTEQIPAGNEYSVSTDKSRLDVDVIHQFLSTKAYWCLNIPRVTVEKSIENSLCFAVFHHDKQVGFARVISDFSTIAYLGDVFIVDEYRGKGLSKLLMKTIMSHPELQGLRRWILLTSDAHGLYEQFGWTTIADPSVWMEVRNPNAYIRNTPSVDTMSN
jgi:N-acetylglutamate synthase-like GNAT family acetyltransferase